MAYNNKYKITVATKNDTISYLYLLEDGYVGSLIEYPATNLQIQYIPKSDDVFEPIIASQLNISIDVTVGEELMPNFTTLNDRKYLVKLLNQDNSIEWQGWALSDSVNISYTTGRKELSFNAVDGIGMLEKINYPLSNDYYLVNLVNCLTYILNSLNQIAFPNQLNLISGISYYADGMLTRSDNTNYEPLIQSYLRITTFLDDNSKPYNCLQVLTEILKGFGAKLFQAEGKWYIITPNQFAQESYYFTEYNYLGSIITSGQKSLLGNISSYVEGGIYFVDNSQLKILRKGYNKVNITKNIDYPANYITNWNLINYTGTNAFGWSQETTGSAVAIVKPYENTDYNSFILQSGGTAAVYPNYIPSLNYNDIINISLDFSNILSNSSKTIMLKVYVYLNDGSTPVYLNTDKKWVTTPSFCNIAYDGGPFPTIAPSITKSVNIDVPPAPISGNLFISFICDTDCIEWVEISNFKLDVSQLFKSITINAYINNVEEYVYTPDINIGINYTIDGKFYYRGALCNSSGNNLTNWFRYEYPSEKYKGLLELVIKQYSNILEHNIINIDSTFFGIVSDYGKFNAAMRITSDDTDVINSVEGKKYILGNSNLNIAASEVQSTLLEITDINSNSITLTTTYVDTNPQRIWGRKRSEGASTSGGASILPLTNNLLYQSGGYFYTDRNLAHKFTHTGGTLYYKVQSENVTSTSIYNIDMTGKIVAFTPR